MQIYINCTSEFDHGHGPLNCYQFVILYEGKYLLKWLAGGLLYLVVHYIQNN